MTKTPGPKGQKVTLLPGEYLAPNGVVMGHGAGSAPRFGADENDQDEVPESGE